jgi:hypothetical protein
MILNRRKFLKLTAGSGLALAMPAGLTTKAMAQSGPNYDGLFFINVHAAGGWDPTSFCDPKGMISEDEENPMNSSYLQSEIQQAGNIRYAPVGYNETFFQKHYNKLLVINGIDTATNGHDSGTRHVWSGKLTETHPSLGAIMAASINPELPMSFISNGGYDATFGLVAPTRSGNTNVLERLAYPFRVNPSNENDRFHTPEVERRILDHQQARLDRLMERQQLPRVAESMSQLHMARMGENDLKRLTDFLPDDLDNSNNQIRRQAQIAMAAYRAGISVSANLSIGGFDTHGNHDNSHIPRLSLFLEGVDFILEEAERMGIADKVVVTMGSDFGRTPRYNSGNGKDHWSITSMMFVVPGVAGNRVIGSSTHEHHPNTIHPTSLEEDESGVRISPEHIHKALRKYAGIDQSDAALMHPFSIAEDLPLFD